MGLARLLLLSFIMLFATLLASFAPLLVTLTQRQVQVISTFGVGLLVGAALTVVIPEGVEAVYGHSGPGEEASGWVGGALMGGFLLMYIIDTITPHAEHSHLRHRPSFLRTNSGLSELEPLSPASSPSTTPPNSRPASLHHHPPLYDWESAKPHRTSTPPMPLPHAHSNSAVSTVVGLLVHSLADGISLGASSLSISGTSHSLDLLIFLAIMLHKAPTAFALSSLLLSSSSSPSFIRQSLIAFSLAAPVGALVTYFLLALVGAGGDGMGWWTGIVLVFSGGTFLFVATGVMNRENEEEGGVGKGARIALVVGGMVTPGLLSRLVGHGH